MVREVLSKLEANIKSESKKFYFVEISPKKITLLSKNANKMSRDNFNLLIKNIEKDGELSSIPLCYIEDEKLIVISGNHRVLASIEAKLDFINVMVFKDKVKKDDLLRLQLGHNAIHGKDNLEILEEILKEFEDIANIELAGINQEYLKDLPKIEKIDIGSIDIELNELVLHYNNLELERLKQLSKEFDNIALCELKNEELIEIREFAEKTANIINLSRGLLFALKVARNFKSNEEEIFDENEVPVRFGFKWCLTNKENEKRFKSLLKQYGNDFNILIDVFLDVMEKQNEN